ncbi:hypothetical protein NAB22_18435 [Proteus mirabilis]|nr:hypothetical protein [Proteus mirabilis]
MSCSAATVATTVACYCCYLLLLSLLLFLATAITRYTAATCYNLDRWSLTGTDNFRQRGNLAPLIQSLGIVCRQQIVSDTVVIILLCC